MILGRDVTLWPWTTVPCGSDGVGAVVLGACVEWAGLEVLGFRAFFADPFEDGTGVARGVT